MPPPGRRAETIEREFGRAGLGLSRLELERFVKLDELLGMRNAELDLTRIEDPVSIVRKHYVDAALAAELMDPDAPLMDLGSGAGFPGIPMAVRKPGWRLLLAEPRRRKLEFIEEAVELLGLGNVEIYPHKVTRAFDRPVGSIVSRDYLSVAGAVELCASILPPGGRLYLMKGANADREIAEARDAPGRGDFGPERTEAYGAIPGWPPRRLVVLRRSGVVVPPAPDWPTLTEIASAGNSRFRGWLSLADSRGIRRRGECLVSGGKSVRDLCRARPEAVLGAIARRAGELEAAGIPRDVPVYLVRREIFPELDLFGTGPPLLLVSAPPLPRWDPEAPLVRDTFLVPFQDPANIGALVRTAAAMGADAVLLREAASPYHPKALRASGPAPWQTGVYAGPPLAELARLGRPDIFALSPGGLDLFTFPPPAGPLGLALGLEGPGLAGPWPPERTLGIPMRGGVESLNAAVAAAMALAVVTRNRMG
ncbi:MAG: 16S rRNA (guanine(527)-N(7))-methyltransferase RsmG [Deltaproteobacteria bacterium]|jgi:16S rRNA (guanine527-N7)-methyltransferase|nr:16S rRNA (guanine(527)-N(7))-methyltransferase RsmG [Deltaproteobacteria bacterium]